MKKIIFLFVVLFSGALLCCKTPKNKIITDKVLAQKKYLANRIPDCDKAMVYMDSIFTPISLDYDKDKPSIKVPERGGIVRILNNIFFDADLFSKQQYLYYINLDCFKNKPASTIFKVFCPTEAFDNLNKIDLMYQKANKKWYINFTITGIKTSAFGVYFGFENGKVVDVTAYQTIYSSH